MRKQLPPLSEMEHITSKELGEHLDAILERINSENVGLVIDHEGKCIEIYGVRIIADCEVGMFFLENHLFVC